ncbi:uncharacterized protein LOC108674670 [Hyalella azteca]|uniref:Uncharacterized protein LOC108674670 n=1 Tax=Hyalella azteca TaxID=294128 RepID=A0A8B7NZ19_HYAAZ|nr:uncharacterized protein LOC108674670 [Hyalella azteca]
MRLTASSSTAATPSLAALALLAALHASHAWYDNAKLVQSVRGDWLFAPGYAIDPANAAIKLTLASFCACRSACTFHGCLALSYDAGTQQCLLSNAYSQAIPLPGAKYMHIPKQNITRGADGLYYVVTPFFPDRQTALAQCAKFGFRNAISRSPQTTQVLKKFATNPQKCTWVGLKKTSPNLDLVWEDGTPLDMNAVTSLDLLKNGGSGEMYFALYQNVIDDMSDGWPCNVICQANFDHIQW